MIWAIWILFSVLIFIGFVGNLLPTIPGLVLFPVATAIVYFTIPNVFSIWTLVVMIGGFAATFAIDFFGTLLGAKWGGASRWGLFGAGLGGLLGLFFGVFGIILGPIIGAIAGELLFKRKTLAQSTRAGVGAGVGLALSTLAKLILACIMLGLLLLDIFFIL